MKEGRDLVCLNYPHMNQTSHINVWLSHCHKLSWEATRLASFINLRIGTSIARVRITFKPHLLGHALVHSIAFTLLRSDYLEPFWQELEYQLIMIIIIITTFSTVQSKSSSWTRYFLASAKRVISIAFDYNLNLHKLQTSIASVNFLQQTKQTSLNRITNPTHTKIGYFSKSRRAHFLLSPYKS